MVHLNRGEAATEESVQTSLSEERKGRPVRAGPTLSSPFPPPGCPTPIDSRLPSTLVIAAAGDPLR